MIYATLQTPFGFLLLGCGNGGDAVSVAAGVGMKDEDEFECIIAMWRFQRKPYKSVGV